MALYSYRNIQQEFDVYLHKYMQNSNKLNIGKKIKEISA